MANKQREYDRGRSHGLQLAMRILEEAGDQQGYELIREEIRLRGRLNLNVNLSLKEIEEGLGHTVRTTPSKADQLNPQIELAQEVERILTNRNKTFRKLAKGLD